MCMCVNFIPVENGVYMTDLPPPYPGIDPNLAPYPMNGGAPAQGFAPQQPPPPGRKFHIIKNIFFLFL